MLTKEMLALVSQLLSRYCGREGGHGELPFGGMSVILFGDFHQFPPVSNTALYDPCCPSDRASIGKALYDMFTTVYHIGHTEPRQG